MDNRRITHLEIRQFKSIEHCQLELSPLTILVGRNGVGKSNILDALRFTADALNTTLEFAIRERGGIDQVRRNFRTGRPTHPRIGVRIALPSGYAHYSFRIAAVKPSAFRVDSEECRVFSSGGAALYHFKVAEGKVLAWTLASTPPAVATDRLFLVAVSGQPEFHLVWDILRRMTFHNLNPEAMKLPARPEQGERLAHDGRNLASVVKRLRDSDADGLARVLAFLQAIGVPITRIDHKHAGALETIEVSQEVQTAEGVRTPKFDAISLSDGTIRALGILISLVSARGASLPGPSLIGIEEPETALHPAAAGVLMEALIESAERTQIITTCHSPDFLDHRGVEPTMIRPVVLENAMTVAGSLSPAKVKVVADHLATAGELLRLDQLQPDPATLFSSSAASIESSEQTE
jgi:predicted ATPase